MQSRFETARVVKVDRQHGIVFGWAIVSTEGEQPYFDTQGDCIDESAMLDAAVEFAKVRAAGDMHERDADGNPVVRGEVLFVYPLTAEMAKALEITTKRTGLLIGMKPEPDVLAKFASGDYTGFSIGGIYTERIEVKQ